MGILSLPKLRLIAGEWRRVAGIPNVSACLAVIGHVHVVVAVFLLPLAAIEAGAAEVYAFGAVSQRSTVLTAQYWNPILEYVSHRSGYRLELRVTRTGEENDALIARGEYDFLYGNHFFKPELSGAGYRVFARPRTRAVTAQIVTLEDSPIQTLADLRGKLVGFPSREAILGYRMTMDRLLRLHIDVQATFGGNQEGIMAQLKVGKVVAAGVNGVVMRHFAEREHVRYRVLWESPRFYDLPLAVHPRVPDVAVAAIRRAFVEMAEDPEGAKALAGSAQTIGQSAPLGFTAANAADYRSFQDYYKKSIVKDGHLKP